MSRLAALTPPHRGAQAIPAPASAPRVAVHANRPIARASLAALLRGEGIEVVVPDEPGRAGSTPAPTPDVVLLSGFEPDPELTLPLLSEYRAPLLLLLDRPLAEDALPQLGARGAVCRECPPERLIEAVRTLAAGGTCFKCDTHASPPDPTPAPPPLLSARERRVASELAQGAQIEEIATVLCISPHTARTHVRNIRRKLGARTSAQAVAMAITMGLVSLPAP